MPLRKPRPGTEGALRGGAQGWCDASADVPTRKEGPALAWRIDARGRNLHCREEGDARGKACASAEGAGARGGGGAAARKVRFGRERAGL